MAQPEDYIAERVWSDFDINVHHRSLTPNWPHTPQNTHLPNQLNNNNNNNNNNSSNNPQSHLPQLLAHSRSLPPPPQAAHHVKHETPSFGASLHLPQSLPSAPGPPPHHLPSSAPPNHHPQFTSPSLYSSFHQLPQHPPNYNCVTSMPIPKSEPRWARPPMQPSLLPNNPYSRPPLPNASSHYAAQYNSFPSFVPGDASNPDLVDPTLASNSSTVLSSVTTSVPDSADRHPSPIVNGASAEVAFNALSVHTDSVSSLPIVAPVPAIPAVPGPLGGICKMKQRRRYSKPKSSRYCHLCARHDRAVGMFPCGNVDLGICQKSVCEKCFALYGLDMEAAKLPRVPANPRWTCPHCNNACPKKAKCHSYDRQTERRRTKTRELKRQLAQKMQAAGTAS